MDQSSSCAWDCAASRSALYSFLDFQPSVHALPMYHIFALSANPFCFPMGGQRGTTELQVDSPVVAELVSSGHEWSSVRTCLT